MYGMPWGYPMMYPTPNPQEQKPEDPFKTMKKWRKFLAEEENKKKEKDKEKDKKKSFCEKVSTGGGDAGKVAMMLMFSTFITGPLWLVSVVIALHFLKTLLP